MIQFKPKVHTVLVCYCNEEGDTQVGLLGIPFNILIVSFQAYMVFCSINSNIERDLLVMAAEMQAILEQGLLFLFLLVFSVSLLLPYFFLDSVDLQVNSF